MSEVVLKVRIPFPDDIAAAIVKEDCKRLVEGAIEESEAFAQFEVEIVEE